ncbi:uncharacterized protein LOC124361187 [Homalodisca vitripennis]|uniref:uncharacterized protein LOC124361187 n=1 Tax=Homalodisca vitripennis TaxID=197043 RepID=UPI001EE9B75D|nr:uncharacterized protein LOC124361187 [Homalodisca vitripennis]
MTYVSSRAVPHDGAYLPPILNIKCFSCRSTLSSVCHWCAKGRKRPLLDVTCYNLEEGKTITSIFLDLSKAFDSLDHNLILTKLRSLGIQQSALEWFESERCQVVEVKQRRNGDICSVSGFMGTEGEVRVGLCLQMKLTTDF